MSHADEERSFGPVFEQPDSVSSYGDEQTTPLEGIGSHASSWHEESQGQSFEGPENTLPLVDLYPTAENWAGASPYETGNPYWNPGAAPQQQPLSAGPSPYGVAGPSPYGVGGPLPYGVSGTQPYGLAVQPSPQWGPYGPQQGPYAMPAQEHPQATTVLVLGVVSLAVPLLSFVAWYMGGKAKAEIDSGAPFPYTGGLKIGHIIGKIMGILTIVGGAAYILFMIAYVLFIVGMLSY